MPSLKIFLIALTLVTGLIPSVTLAQTTPADDKATYTNLINPIGGSEKDPSGFIKGQGSAGIIQNYVGTVINKILAVVGSLTLLVFVYGGFMWLTSAGESDKVTTGTNAMLYAVIGLFIIFGAYVILNTVLKGLTG